jgi:hypothetical protein
MHLIPHRHFGMTGPLQQHLLVYTVVIAALLTIFFDLSRIAALGAIFYLVMDMGIHWGVLRFLRREAHARAPVLVIAIALDGVVLSAFLVSKARSDLPIIVIALSVLSFVFLGEWLFLRSRASGAGR